ncbi:MAG: hypothetical protein CMJ76_04800 [Planctomycetaceae bacterium]|nr:hypothetical protein [Planctomycetaceae bacterium]|tara:strand:+ start:2562 stop:2837 length:276 start_codon:yes stop_codon:yes gene_type:complete
MKIKIEYFGIPRQRVGVASESYEFDGEETGIHDILRAVADKHPAFQQHCMDGETINKHMVVNLNGNQFFQSQDGVTRDGDALLILSMDAGG